MSVVSVNKIEDNYTQNALTENATEVYRAISNDADDNGSVIVAATGIPDIGDFYGTSTQLNAQSINARHEDPRTSPLIWLVTVEYGVLTGGLQPGPQILDPLQRPSVQFSSTFTPVEFVAQQGYLVDYTNPASPTVANDLTPVCNSAGELFLNPPVATEYILNMTVQKNFPDSDPVGYADYIGKVNDPIWRGFPKYTLLFTNVSSQGPIYEGNYPAYWIGTFEFAYRPKGWFTHIQDKGFNQLVQPGGSGPYKLRKILAEDGKTNIEGFLDGMGKLLDVPPGMTFNFEDAKYRSYLMYGTADFDDLGLF